MISSRKIIINIATYLFKSKLKLVIIFFLIILITNWLTIMPFKSTANVDLSGLMNALPEGYRSLFGDFNLINTPAGYLAAKNFSMAYPLIQGILGISLAAFFFGKNKTNGLNSYLLTKAISRKRLFISINLAIIIIMFIVNLFNLLSIIIFSYLFEFKIDFSNLHMAFIGLNLMSFCFMGITGLISNIINREVGIGAGYYLFFQSYIAKSLSTLSKNLEFIKYFSLFHYNNYTDLLFGKLSILNFLILVSIFLLISVFNFIAFKRHDY